MKAIQRSYLNAAKYHADAIRHILDLNTVSSDVVSHLNCLYNDLVKRIGSIYESPQIRPANIFCYNFGSSVKMLITVNGVVVGENPYWLEILPFVLSKNNHYELIVPNATVLDYKNEGPFAPLLHHNHYGHFIGDSLGKIVHYQNELPNMTILTVEPIDSIKKEIRLHCESKSIKYLPCPPIGSGFLYTNLLLELDIMQPWLYLLFLARQRIIYESKQSREGVLFLLRKDRRRSRITNLEDILNLCSDIGGKIEYAEDHSIGDISKILSIYQVIVTEAGSCHLNAMIAASKYTHIIALTPLPMLAQPTQDMVLGGWPYIGFHPMLELFTSYAYESCESTPITSWRCSYSPQDLKKLILKCSFQPLLQC